MNFSKELNAAQSLIKEANKILLRKFNRSGTKAFKFKRQGGIVTRIDIEINNFIVTKLHELFPYDDIVSEEADEISGRKDRVWYVDPIDGTGNFARGLPIFGVSIGMARDGQIRLGAIGTPIMNEIYIAETGQGAYRNDKKINVRAKHKEGPLYIFGACERKAKKRLKKFFTDSDFSAYIPRIFGCAIEHMTAVAAGRADAAIMMDIFPWDVAAGAVIVREAGGRVTNLWGDEWTVNDRTIIASSGAAHKDILKITKYIE